MSNELPMDLNDARYIARHVTWFTTETLEKAQQLLRDYAEYCRETNLGYWTRLHNRIENELEQRDKRQGV